MSDLFPEVMDYLLKGHPELVSAFGYSPKIVPKAVPTMREATQEESINSGSLGGQMTDAPANEKAMLYLRAKAPMAHGVIENLGHVSNAITDTLGDPAQNVGVPGVNMALTAFHGSPASFDKFAMEKIGTGQRAQSYGYGLYFSENPEVANRYAKNLASWNRTDPHLYHVDLPDEHVSKMLDWDKPLSEQPKSVIDALLMHSQLNPGSAISGMLSPTELNNTTGASVYQALVRELKGSSDAAETLNWYGIPGVKYMDQGTTGVGKGAQNFVVFDENIPQILKKE